MSQIVLKPYSSGRVGWKASGLGVKEWQIAESTALCLITDGTYTTAMFNASLEELNAESLLHTTRTMLLMRLQVQWPLCGITLVCFAGAGLSILLPIISSSNMDDGHSFAPKPHGTMVVPIVLTSLWLVATCCLLARARMLILALKDQLDVYIARINARDNLYGVQWLYREIRHPGAGDNECWTEHEIVVKRLAFAVPIVKVVA
ncbi:hypothetical protein SPRG_06483 [Saprolegnia parasitica CBS 223.65]|uniref:Uncharacterized protein n=1 Tax=Saprolegnia parasitica (strain CBS 223.65) TaxID=695850 RepID=A0A067CDR2_SAPPC|nr:hypothetical protein SPRG_06483 [Saprolegnia parasitica CBS 223.65]KDO28628.1 hypothetical protein SPRG_06483 [Saprolegnia parasitica CBS 223.65]|eukprot:XP_012200690.1 hypothetical protein SPRG_06483 [Saprolegnia parasitica CBS 223.65]